MHKQDWINVKVFGELDRIQIEKLLEKKKIKIDSTKMVANRVQVQ